MTVNVRPPRRFARLPPLGGTVSATKTSESHLMSPTSASNSNSYEIEPAYDCFQEIKTLPECCPIYWDSLKPLKTHQNTLRKGINRSSVTRIYRRVSIKQEYPYDPLRSLKGLLDLCCSPGRLNKSVPDNGTEVPPPRPTEPKPSNGIITVSIAAIDVVLIVAQYYHTLKSKLEELLYRFG